MKYLQQAKIKSYREKHCPEKCPLTHADMQDAVLDHCHKTGMVRAVLHRQSNAMLGRIENAWRRYCQKSSKLSLPEALRNMADHIEKEHQDILHPVGCNQLIKKFKAKNISKKIQILLDMGFDFESIDGLSAAELTKQYRKTLQKDKWEK
tara:strand:- start:90 stop:539 length:450 start_codon:yes stop_codon:yes gene_type:complete